MSETTYSRGGFQHELWSFNNQVRTESTTGKMPLSTRPGRSSQRLLLMAVATPHCSNALYPWGQSMRMSFGRGLAMVSPDLRKPEGPVGSRLTQAPAVAPVQRGASQLRFQGTGLCGFFFFFPVVWCSSMWRAGSLRPFTRCHLLVNLQPTSCQLFLSWSKSRISKAEHKCIRFCLCLKAWDDDLTTNYLCNLLLTPWGLCGKFLVTAWWAQETCYSSVVYPGLDPDYGCKLAHDCCSQQLGREFWFLHAASCDHICPDDGSRVS